MTDYTGVYPNLRELFNFLHQDWKLMFEWQGKEPNYQAAIRKLKVDDSPATRQRNISELKDFISLNLDEVTLRKIINRDFGSGFYPPGVGLTCQEWLESVLNLLEEPMEKTTKEFLPKFAGEV